VAKEGLVRRTELLQDYPSAVNHKSNLATLQQQIETKQSNFEACTQMMRVKMAQQQQSLHVCKGGIVCECDKGYMGQESIFTASCPADRPLQDSRAQVESGDAAAADRNEAIKLRGMHTDDAGQDCMPRSLIASFRSAAAASPDST
jgi:hypothetical protein